MPFFPREWHGPFCCIPTIALQFHRRPVLFANGKPLSVIVNYDYFHIGILYNSEEHIILAQI